MGGGGGGEGEPGYSHIWTIWKYLTGYAFGPFIHTWGMFFLTYPFKRAIILYNSFLSLSLTGYQYWN